MFSESNHKTVSREIQILNIIIVDKMLRVYASHNVYVFFGLSHAHHD